MIRCYVRSEVPYMAAATRLYRCRKCRERVFDSQCVVTVHGQQNTLSDGSAVLPSVSCQDVSMETVWYVTVDSAPEWILNNIETAMWTKGKLLCPKCEGRLGSFDFTKTVKCACGKFTVPPIHILQCRIDQVSTASATQEILRRRQSKITARDISVNPNNEAEKNRDVSGKPEEISSLDISIPFGPKMVPVDTSSAVTFDPDLTRMQDNDSASFLPSSEMTGARSFDSTLTPGAERLFRAADLDRRQRSLVESGQRSLVDGSYSSPERTRSFVGKEIQKQSTSESDIHLTFVIDQCDGNRKDVKKSVKENCSKGDNPQQTGNQQQESHEIRTLSDEGVATNTEGYSESGPSLNALPVYQGHRDVSDDGCPSNAEQPERLTLSRRDLLGDEHRHPDAPRRSKQRSGRKRGITKADTSPADHDQNNDVDPVYPEEHTCPVCLDLYCYPMRTSPCDHVFCDPCLRRLARATPVNTPCPLCRRVIAKCHGEDDLAGDLKTWYSALYKKRQVMENKFRKDSYHKLPQLNPATLRLPNMDRLGQDPWQPFDRARNLYNRMGVNLPYVLHSVVFIAVMVCNTVYRFSVELASLPLSTALVVTGLVFIALLAVSGLLAISHVVRVVGSVSQVLGQAIVEFMGSVFLLPRVESFKSESSQSLLPTSVRIRAMTANFFLVVIVVIICRYVFFRRVNVQFGRNV
ncbi:uncharacterized protein LOC110465947 [Mizuhopecten yessoensis]|uniref:uncharacterized protein LOC110465947 n=1 Tax=Mizuhopecten yessoensis TaxID=6573 RepID=UPI000B45F6DE|nr:uncharacterized protein LOC110465947 [Mizuhopecten yessoensis]XP_021377832.1 uncharacterized protein LOC110465947 [Mizuhopecten yessoensis]XP_021377833.1 uncharacterized protein LOC110465947 [Mizuhopecten yessoensis]